MPRIDPTVQNRIRGLRQRGNDLPRAFRLIWNAAPAWTLLWLVVLAAQGLLPAAGLFLTRNLVDSLVDAIQAGVSWDSARPVLVFAALMACVLLAQDMLRTIGDWVRTAQAELIQDHVNAIIHKKAAEVDLAFYESPEYQDHLYRALHEASTRPLSLLENAGAMLQNGLSVLATAAVLLMYGWWLPLALLVSTLPAFFVLMANDRRYHAWSERMTTNRRWTQYYGWLLSTDRSAAELRLFGLDAHFRERYQTLRHEMRTEHLAVLRKQVVGKLCAAIIAMAISGAALAWMVLGAMRGALTLGDLALFYQAFNNGQGVVRAFMGSLGHIYANSLFLGNLFRFLEIEPQVVDPDDPRPVPRELRQGIRFRDVTFRYPGTQRAALQDFDVELPSGRIIAIVGPNGAGKSTLVKLLCRFYDPQEGSVELDGTDLREFSVKEYRERLSVLFQVPADFAATVGENIAFGNVTGDRSQEAVESAARAAGAHETIMRLPRGYKTMMGKGFPGGAELSVGEWQRVALSRAFVRQASILILDEPTSFMDSWAEADWFDRMRKLVAGRTTVVITHRFTIAMRADLIHVMDQGRIVESGSHLHLLKQGGLYSQSWNEQMQASSELSDTAHAGADERREPPVPVPLDR